MKLVGQVGIGTVASGVAKAGADVIQVSGHDGGTGASPLTSVKHAGGPWELGLAESHQQLTLNGLRDRVVLRVDGGLKTGMDVIKGAMLGADEFGFGTIAMISVGCIVARICHTNNCPVGVTTQKEKLRKKFVGVPSDTLNFFIYAADEVRSALRPPPPPSSASSASPGLRWRPRHVNSPTLARCPPPDPPLTPP